MSFLLTIIEVIFLIGFLIFIHEGGHYIAAKICKIKVKEFAIGFGPKIYQKQGKENADSHNEPVQNSQLGDMELTDVILAKNRNGQTGNLKLAFMMNIGKFTQIDLKGE